jgi:hypothetical protein
MLPEEPEGWSSLAVPWGQHEDYFLAAAYWPDSLEQVRTMAFEDLFN